MKPVHPISAAAANTTAFILAAGTGTRLRPLTENRPKALVPVAGETLLDRALGTLAGAGVTETVLVGGYAAERLLEHPAVGGGKTPLVVNPRYLAGNVLTLLAAKAEIAQAAARGRHVLLMNTDHIYPVELMVRFLADAREITCACDFDRPLGPDDMKIALSIDEHGGRRISAIHKQLEKWDGGYIGMTFVPARRVAEHLAAAEARLAQFGESTSVEHVLNTLIERGVRPVVRDLSGIGWLEVDSVEDLHAAEAVLRGDALAGTGAGGATGSDRPGASTAGASFWAARATT